MKHFKPDEIEQFSVASIPKVEASARWYCVVVKPSWSARVTTELYALGHRTFTPQARRWRGSERRFTAVERPIAGMSNYLFVEIDYPRQSFAQVRGVRGVVEIMSTNGNPIAFSRETESGKRVNPVIEFIIRQLKGEWDEIEGPDAFDKKLPIGAKVRVVEGPHEDKIAFVAGHKGKKIFAKVEGHIHASIFFASSLRAA